MKKLFILAFIAVASFVVSCSKDDDNSLEGTWYLESVTVNGVAADLTACEKKSFIAFSGDTYSSIDYYEGTDGNCVELSSEKGTYSVSNGTITTVDSEGATSTISYSVSGNTLTMTGKYTENGVEYTTVIIFKKK